MSLASGERVQAYLYNETTQQYEALYLDGRSGSLTIPTDDSAALRDFERSSEGSTSIQPASLSLRQMSDPVAVKNLKIVVIRFAESMAVARGQQIGATFEKGIFACPSGTRRYFFECTVVTNTVTPTVTKFLSMNVGNASIYCNGQYNYKLCSKTTLQRVRDNINENVPEIITIQEVWKGNCDSIDAESDRFCSNYGQVDRDWEMRNLLGPDYDYRCTSLLDGGYDCVGLKRAKFMFEANSENVQYSYQNKPNIDCAGYDNSGSDTGIFGFTVRQIGQLSPVPYTFDVWTVHTATPLKPRNFACRANQLDNLFKAIYRTQADARRHIVAGDFNSTYDYIVSTPPADVAKLRTLTLRHDADVQAIALRPLYMVSNAKQPSFGLSKPLFTFDHVLSNFTDDTTNCSRVRIGRGLDHSLTYCSLYGMDSGTKTISYEAFDTSGSNLGPFFIQSALTPSRKGAYLPYISTSKVSLTNNRIPNPIEAIAHRTISPAGLSIYLQMKPKLCDYAPNIEIRQSLNAGEAASFQKYRAAVFMDYCPSYK